MQIQEHAISNTPALLDDEEVLNWASRILFSRLKRQGKVTNPASAVDFLRSKLGAREREVFAVIYLSNSNEIIEYKELFFGTINAASVYPREVVKDVLKSNAANVILAHNHPSGCCDISDADRYITKKLIDALALIDVQILDHIVIGDSYASFAERGIINTL